MMRIFIHHDAKGNIISVTKTEIMDASLTHPYGSLAVGGNVLEVEPTSDVQALACHEIGQRFAVDIKKKGLRKLPVVIDKDVKPVVVLDKDVKPVVVLDKDVKPVVIGKDTGKQK